MFLNNIIFQLKVFNASSSERMKLSWVSYWLLWSQLDSLWLFEVLAWTSHHSWLRNKNIFLDLLLYHQILQSDAPSFVTLVLCFVRHSFWWLLGTAPFGIIFLQNIKCTTADPALLSLLVSQEDDSKDTDGRTNIEDSDNKNRVRSVITNSQQCVLKHSLHD